MLVQNTQVAHAQISEMLTPFNRMMQTGGSYLFWNTATPAGIAALDGEVNRQALAIAYSNDFLLMFWVTVPTALLLLVMRGGQTQGAPAPAHAMAD